MLPLLTRYGAPVTATGHPGEQTLTGARSTVSGPARSGEQPVRVDEQDHPASRVAARSVASTAVTSAMAASNRVS